ncbi:hypothetical protein AVEN_229572-1 [Araneus ventricosus]|uniref:Uncharacterized protein n=1 Tax=Araneus ventricosus TaxID=182803 RepID=A0A4Y2GFG8_ARAVE|nr:hypothetical protein AVEN_229572-1 [Araneus ventricosus]
MGFIHLLAVLPVFREPDVLIVELEHIFCLDKIRINLEEFENNLEIQDALYSRGDLIVRLRSRRVPGLKPDSTEDPLCMWAC